MTMMIDDFKFIYSEKATKFREISTVDLSYEVPIKSKVEILQNFVAFSENMNFKMAKNSYRKVFQKSSCVQKIGDNKKKCS